MRGRDEAYLVDAVADAADDDGAIRNVDDEHREMNRAVEDIDDV